MEELYRLANEYYTKLESFKDKEIISSKYLWLALLFFIPFLCTFYEFLNLTLFGENRTIFNVWFGAALLFEIIMLLLWTRLVDLRDSKNIRKLTLELRYPIKNIEEAKVALLRNYFACNENDFSKVAKNLSDMLDVSSFYSNKKSFIERVFCFIYNQEANNRVLALFILICSLTTILSISNGQDITSVFSFYSNASAEEIFKLFSILLGTVFVVAFALIQVFTALKYLMITISLNLLFKNSKNLEAVKYLIRDLNNYHIFTKTEDKKIIIR